jgi:hypothetical protein
VIFFVLNIIFNIHVKEFQHFSFLANSFLQGKLYFIDQYSSWWHDAVFFSGNYYWPQGPLPAVILMPFVYWFNRLGLFFYQSYIQIFLNIGIYFLVYTISMRFKYTKTESLFFAFAFVFASTFLGVSFWPTGWFFSQVVTTFFLFLALKEFVTKKRPWVLGILFGLVLLTRVTAFLGILFILWQIFFDNKLNIEKKIKSYLLIAIGVAPFILFFLLYNYLRFGNFFEQGYSLQSIAGNLSSNEAYGLFNLVHIPGNIYYFLISPPTPVFKDSFSHILTPPFIKADPWGLGIIFTSPYLFYLLLLDYKDKISAGLILTIIIIAVPIFMYYGIGWFQFGYRYSLDFLPFLFFIFMRNYKRKFGKMSRFLKFLIIASAIFNFYLFRTIFNV